MKRIMSVGALSGMFLSLWAMPVLATPTALFGNTLQITRADSTVIRFYVNADGTYQRTAPDGTSSGTWAEANGQMCFTQQSPIAGEPACGPQVTQSVGDSWSATRPDGSISQLTVTPGR